MLRTIHLTAATLITVGAYAVEPIGGTRLGNTYFADDGTTSQRIGNTEFCSNGQNCTTIGRQFYCNYSRIATDSGNALFPAPFRDFVRRPQRIEVQ